MFAKVALLVIGLHSADTDWESQVHQAIVRPFLLSGIVVHPYTCFPDGPSNCNTSSVSEFWTGPDSQYQRLGHCYECVTALGFAYTHFIRTRPDVVYFDQLQPGVLNLPAGTIASRLRSARTKAPLTDRVFSVGWGSSWCPDGCDGVCDECFLMDDQFAVVRAEDAAIYFGVHELVHSAPVVRYQEQGLCPTWMKNDTTFPERRMTAVMRAYNISTTPLDFQFRLARMAQSHPPPAVATSVIC